MKTKTMLLAVSALAALAFAALPALAAADEVDWTNPHFTVTSDEEEATELSSNGQTITCEEVTGTGEFTSPSKTTGHIQLLFHGCHLEGFECHSPSHEEGTITTRVLPFHIVQLTNASNEDTAGILMTPNTDSTPNTFAQFSCVFELVPIHVIGNGVIGDITSPGYNEESSTATIDFGLDEEGNQEFTTVHGDETETEYELEAEISGETHPATQKGKGIIHFTENAKAKITTTPATE